MADDDIWWLILAFVSWIFTHTQTQQQDRKYFEDAFKVYERGIKVQAASRWSIENQATLICWSYNKLSYGVWNHESTWSTKESTSNPTNVCQIWDGGMDWKLIASPNSSLKYPERSQTTHQKHSTNTILIDLLIPFAIFQFGPTFWRDVLCRSSHGHMWVTFGTEPQGCSWISCRSFAFLFSEFVSWKNGFTEESIKNILYIWCTLWTHMNTITI